MCAPIKVKLAEIMKPLRSRLSRGLWLGGRRACAFSSNIAEIWGRRWPEDCLPDGAPSFPGAALQSFRENYRTGALSERFKHLPARRPCRSAASLRKAHLKTQEAAAHALEHI